jgi:hypothetical protein
VLAQPTISSGNRMNAREWLLGVSAGANSRPNGKSIAGSIRLLNPLPHLVVRVDMVWQAKADHLTN